MTGSGLPFANTTPRTNMTSESNELAFLRYFYDAVEDALGPASDDIYESIKDDWVAVGEALPEGYERECDSLEGGYEDDEDDYNEDAEEDDVE